ncbi:MAG: DUF4349 domain-containing protein [Lentisphaeria bacterium]|nr:DUF4349 domain-containing protein [Lentisphaeria bacterium]
MNRFFTVIACAAIFCGCNNVAYDHDAPRKSMAAPPETLAEDSVAVNSPALAGRRRGISGSAADAGASYFNSGSRMMAYTAGFTLTVKELDKALNEVKMLAESLGGYLVSSARGNMQIKIPVAKADEFLNKAGDIGKKSDFRISAEDLTDTITDIEVRLDNLRRLRTRLTELLAQAKNVNETLSIERELNRVTTEIERIDAQLQNNKNRVAFVTFSVAVIEEHGAIPGGTPMAIERFSFLHQLSATDLAGSENEPLFGLALPEKFVAVTTGARQGKAFTATTSDDCIFRTWQTGIPDDSQLEFWEKVICRALAVYDDYTNIKCFPLSWDGRKAVKITAQVTTSRGIQRYMAVISVKCAIGDDELRIVEFFGPDEAFAIHENTVLDTVL